MPEDLEAFGQPIRKRDGDFSKNTGVGPSPRRYQLFINDMDAGLAAPAPQWFLSSAEIKLQSKALRYSNIIDDDERT